MIKKKTNEYVVILVLDCLLVVLYFIHQHPAFLYTVLALSFLSVAIPFLRKWIALGFDFITGIIGKAFSYLLLGLVFYCILLPIGILRKITGRSLPVFKKGSAPDSQFIAVPKKIGKEDFEKMW